MSSPPPATHEISSAFTIKGVFEQGIQLKRSCLSSDRLLDGHDGDDVKQNTTDMTAFVQNLLQQMQSRFQTMSDSIITKIDEMGNRIDELDQSINELWTEMGEKGSPSPSAVKLKEDP